MANFGVDDIIDKAKDVLGNDRAAVTAAAKSGADKVADAGSNLLGMAGDMLAKLTPEDQGLFGMAQNVISKLDFPVDIGQILKDGKIDMSDLLSLGSIMSKLTGKK